MTETPDTIAAALDKLAERARDDLRNPDLRTLFLDLLGIVRAVADRPPAEETGMTRAELADAVGGAAFLATLSRQLDRIAQAREQDVEETLRFILAAARQTPPNGAARQHPRPTG